jgi:hypothetical protein
MRTLHRAAALCCALLSLSLFAACSSGGGESSPPPTPEPLLALDTASLSFEATLGGGNPAAQQVLVTNSGAGTLAAPSTGVAYETGAGWLTANVLPGAEPGTYLVSVQPTVGALAAGTHRATVSIHSAGATNTPREVAVSLTVVDPAQPSIGLSPASLGFTAVEGGAAPAAQQVTVSNQGGATLAAPTATVQYANGAGWLSTQVSGSAAPYTLAVTPSVAGLAAGTYAATISVASAGATNSPRTVDVSLVLVPPLGACNEKGDACSAAAECCSAICGPTGCATADFCAPAGSPCATDADCCSLSCPGAGTAGATCAAEPCRTAGTSCASGAECCSGTCTGGACAALPPGPTNSTCTTLAERCTTSSECCSQNCQGATAGTPGWCAPAYTCNAPGDVCWRPEDCCSGLCAQTAAGQPGRCDDASGDCTQDGVPCENDSNCCTRKCVDLGTGTKVCQPSGGCRMTGNYCDSTASCCGGTNEADPSLESSYRVFCDGPGGAHPGPTEWDTRTQDTRTCTGGTSCNPPGNICGYKASQNCCYEGSGSGKAVCKPDSNGILRCFGGPVNETCPTGWDADDPLCCKEAGAVCQFRDQCCGGAPCVPDGAGILRCAAPPEVCVARNDPCTPEASPACCEGTSCVVSEEGAFCEPPPGCIDDGLACSTGGDACCSGLCVPSTPGGTTGACASCSPNGGACASDSQCCSGSCDPESGTCLAICVGESGSCTVNSDCCGGLECDVPAGATSGTCKDASAACAGTGQVCGADQDCCNFGAGETCQGGVCAPPPACSTAAETCTFGGGECCDGLLCWTVGAGSELVPCGEGDVCFCGDTAACLPAGGVCTWGTPCCAGLTCATVGTESSCDPENPAGCTCSVP